MSVFVRRLEPGRTFEQVIAEWEADRGFGVPTRVVNAQSLDDPRDCRRSRARRPGRVPTAAA
ncbi:MAG TPA: hypothetical protein VFW14_17730 [Gaiellales bacterium]|nr:hypothetical protein [Gaiellales bacterium]